jgi:hypothetical protein
LRRCGDPGFLTEVPGDAEPLDPDLVRERLSECLSYGKGTLHTGIAEVDVLWDKLSDTTVEEVEEARVDAHVYLSRYGRIDPGYWLDKETSERRHYLERLSALVGKENEMSSRTEDR